MPIGSQSWRALDVAARTDEGSNVVSIDLVSPNRDELPPFEAGSHIDVLTPSGQIRQYSLCGSPFDRCRYRIGVALHPTSRGGSQSIHEGLRVGSRVLTGRPRNNFPLAHDTVSTILLAKDIGVTPMIAMAWDLHQRASNFRLCYLSRCKSDIPFLEELYRSPFAANVRLFSGGAQEFFSGQTRAWIHPQDSSCLYVCGSSNFVRDAVENAKDLGWRGPNIRSEGFTPSSFATVGQPLEIVASRSGQVVTVTPPQSIATALRAAGIAVDLSCEQGICGTCLTNVIDGIPEHRDSCQTKIEKEANKQIAICCSWAVSSTLVLDI